MKKKDSEWKTNKDSDKSQEIVTERNSNEKGESNISTTNGLKTEERGFVEVRNTVDGIPEN